MQQFTPSPAAAMALSSAVNDALQGNRVENLVQAVQALPLYGIEVTALSSKTWQLLTFHTTSAWRR
jgi:hypothetical protein